jgi:hypothetical protein
MKRRPAFHFIIEESGLRGIINLVQKTSESRYKQNIFVPIVAQKYFAGVVQW